MLLEVALHPVARTGIVAEYKVWQILPRWVVVKRSPCQELTICSQLISELTPPVRVRVNNDCMPTTEVAKLVRKGRTQPEVQIPKDDREGFKQIRLAGAV